MKILLVHNTHFSIQTKVIVKGIAQQFDRNSSIRTYHYASINNTQELTVHNNLIEMAVKVLVGETLLLTIMLQLTRTYPLCCPVA
jgi:hypothetical protein